MSNRAIEQVERMRAKMNPRIRALMDKAELQAYYDAQQDHIEKFAELIVQECATAIINDSRLSDVRSAANGCVRTIKEHFGVE